MKTRRSKASHWRLFGYAAASFVDHISLRKDQKSQIKSDNYGKNAESQQPMDSLQF
jgi:hypothetical protein